MKKLVLAGLLAIAAGTLTTNTTHAQVHVSFNIGVQPVWGPTGYDYAQTYYFPDIDAYYDVPAQLFYYNYRGRWMSARNLPGTYGNFDLYNSYKVVINHPRPWLHADMYRRQYLGYRGRHNQPVIRDSRDQRYFENPNHPMHNQWNGGHDGGFDHRGPDNHGNYGDHRGGYDDHRGQQGGGYNNQHVGGQHGGNQQQGQQNGGQQGQQNGNPQGGGHQQGQQNGGQQGGGGHQQGQQNGGQQQGQQHGPQSAPQQQQNGAQQGGEHVDGGRH